MRSPLATTLAVLLLAPAPALANPKGGQLRSGNAVIREGAGRVDIHQRSHSATLTWDSFDIAPGEVTQFHQPGKDSVAINRIFQGDASQILGSLQANGHVYLINPHGILFGKEATVNVHALIATTTVDGRDLAAEEGFDPSASAAPGAQIVNQGSIQSGSGGFVYLIAPYVRNGKDGVIVSPEGEVMIEAGATVYLTDRPDGRRFAVEYTAPSGGQAVNLGKLFADGGLARLRGEVVTQGGLVQANAIREQNGVIELVAEAELTLAAGSVTRAKGGEDAGSDAGRVDAWSDGVAVMEEGARIEVSAAAEGADGGFAEVSAARRVEVAGTFAAQAGKGGERGEVVIDPEEIVVAGSTRFQGAGSVLLAADREISVEAGARIDLAQQPGNGARGGRQTLELRSGGDVVFEEGALIRDSGTGKVWDVEVVAGESATGARAAGGGDLIFEGGAGSGLRLARGNARGVAAGDVILSDGAGMSSIEGDVDVEAGGDVIFEAGRSPGVDTAIESGSGDVRVVAGGSVRLQPTPGSGGNAAIRTRGIYGTDSAGRITKTAGGDVLVWAKTGSVDAGVGNRWIEPGPNFPARGAGRPSGTAQQGPDFDPVPVVSTHNEGRANEGNTGDEGVLGIGTEAGGNVVVIAGADVNTRETGLQRSGGTAAGTGTSYDGAHIGAFGVPVYYDTDPDGQFLVYQGAVPLPDAPENRVIVIAGGDITGDYMVRNGEATLMAGYELPAGVESVADLVSLGLDQPGSLTRERLRGDLEVSALADGGRARGWVGTLGKPITVDLVEGSVDLLGRNGVAVRAVENPSLVYSPESADLGTTKVASYGDDDFALLESEAGDVVLIGNQADLPDPKLGGSRAVNPLVWLLPPSLIVRTGKEGSRPGDFVQLEDFLLFPSADGGLTLDVAGKARTASGAASSNTIVSIAAESLGTAADRDVSIPAGAKLRDPATGLIYVLGDSISLGPRTPAQPAQVRVTFEALPGFEDREIAIPAGTRVEDYRGRIFTAGCAGEQCTTNPPPPQVIPALANRLSVGEVRFVPEGGEARSAIEIASGTLMQTPGGTLFEVVTGAALNPGDRAVTVEVRAVAGAVGVDAAAGELQLVTPIPGIARATNRLATQRPASAQITFFAEVPGAADRSDLGRIKNLLDPIPGARFAYAEAPQVGGGADPGKGGVLLTQPTARASVIGPVANLPEGEHVLELVDPRVLPRGVSANQIVITARTQSPAELVPAVLREPAGDGRPDLPGNRITVADSATLWQRVGGGATATLKQSDADPAFDARGIGASFDYATYYGACRSGAACQLNDPFSTEQQPLKTGRGPTHAQDREPASLHARLGFERIAFDLAEAATLRAGPGEGEEFDGQQADVIDVALVTQHSKPSDVTSVLVPYGDALFAAEAREAVDRETGLTALLPANPLSGVTVAGPGSLVVAVGVQGSNGSARATGVGGRLGLSDFAIQGGSARGIETIGNVVNASLPVGGASIDIVTAGNVELNDRGAIDTLQGGDIHITSLGGDLIGGQPEAGFEFKRGLFTLYVPPGASSAAESGGGSIFVDVAGSFDIGRSVTAALSGGDITLRSRTGSISAGSAEPFEILGIAISPQTNQPEVRYTGGGIFASSGSVELVAEQDVDIGAGITGGTIAIAAGRNINAGQGAISSSGNVSINAGGSISGTISASGAISIGSGTVSQGASLSAGGLVVGGGSVASNTGPGKVGAETAVAASRPAAEQAAAQSAVAGGQSRRSGVMIDVTSRPASGEDEEEDDEG